MVPRVLETLPATAPPTPELNLQGRVGRGAQGMLLKKQQALTQVHSKLLADMQRAFPSRTRLESLALF